MRVYKHIVMWRFKESHNGKSALENARWMKEHLEGLVGRVPELLSAEVGISPSLEQEAPAPAAPATPALAEKAAAPAPSAPAENTAATAPGSALAEKAAAPKAAPSGEYHACLVSTFADPEALARYKVNPLHKEISAYCKAARECRVAFDWWSESEI